MIGSGSTDPYITLFNRAALLANSWLDAGPNVSSQIFGDMVESISNGQKTIQEALRDANDQYNVALRNASPQ